MKDILQRAKELCLESDRFLVDSENWSRNKRCIISALDRAILECRGGQMDVTMAGEIAAEIIGIPASSDPNDDIPFFKVIEWNDAPGRTRTEVIRVFERALENYR